MKKLKKILCILFGHPNAVMLCFGYVHCARCGELLGDKLAGVYDTRKTAVIGCGCDECKQFYKEMSFVDKLLTPRIENTEMEDA